tara:strand:- start:9 stop:419 length:411 start_codon:yes stop_codon:yes gene_type:complete
MIFNTLVGSKKRVSKPKRYLIDWRASSRSKLQLNTKTFLEPYWALDVVFEEFPVAGTRMTLDFYNASQKIAVEVQGGQHLKYTPYFHGKSKSSFLGQIRRDNDKEKFCALNNIRLVEVYPDDKLSVTLFKTFGVVL